MITVTLGGVLVGLCVLLRFAIIWYPGKSALMKKPMQHVGRLLPFVTGWAYGALGTLSVMGLIGWAFDTALWASNWLGDAALFLGVGEQPGQSAQGAVQPLTTFGNCAVVLFTVGVLTAIKYTKNGKDIKLGMWSGLCLGTSSGVAGVAAVPLATAVNELGNLIFGGVT